MFSEKLCVVTFSDFTSARMGKLSEGLGPALPVKIVVTVGPGSTLLELLSKY
jgi:hypothetical protein